MQVLPTEKKKLRACMLCSLVKTHVQFKATGCDNCESILKMQGDNERVMQGTSSLYDGLIAMCRPVCLRALSLLWWCDCIMQSSSIVQSISS